MSSTDTRIRYIRAQVANTGLYPDKIARPDTDGFMNYGIRKRNGWFIFMILAVVIIGLGWTAKPLARASRFH